MNIRTLCAACALILASACAPAASTPTEASLRNALAAFDATTQIDGGGPDAYAALLHSEFTFWSVPGDSVTPREDLIAGLREWWESGNRVGADETAIVDIRISQDLAIVRLATEERFVDLEGAATGEFSGHVVQVWVHEGGGWRLLSATAWAAQT